MTLVAPNTFFGPFDVIVSNTILGWGCVQQSHAMGKPCVWLIHQSEFGHDYIMQQPRQAHEAFSVADTVIFPAELTLRLYKGFARAKPFPAIHYGIGDVREGACPTRAVQARAWQALSWSMSGASNPAKARMY